MVIEDPSNPFWYPQTLGVNNVAGSQINPATEETLSAIQTLTSYINDTGMKSGFVDNSNSSADAILSGGSFVGQWVDVSKYKSVNVAVKTDQDGTILVEFSPDGANADSQLSYSYYTGVVNKPKHLEVTRKYYRVSFTNTSASNQTYFRLQSIVGNQTQLTSALNSIITQTDDGIVVREMDFNYTVADGLYQNLAITIKEGITPAVGTGAATQSLWQTSGMYTGFPVGAPEEGQLVVAGADTGVVWYTYMATDTDTNYTFGFYSVAGAGSYNLGHNIWRSNFMYFVKNSDTLFNVDRITLRHAITVANVFCTIEAGYSQSYCAAYTVPYNCSIKLDRINGSIRGGNTASHDGFFWYRPYGESPRLRFPFENQFGGLYFDDVDYAIKIPARVDLMPMITYAATNNAFSRLTYRFIKTFNG